MKIYLNKVFLELLVKTYYILVKSSQATGTSNEKAIIVFRKNMV